MKPVPIAHRSLSGAVDVKELCERCGTRPPTHEVRSDDPKAMWSAGVVVLVGRFHRQVCEPCKGEVLAGG
jgi:hypothetical protein